MPAIDLARLKIQSAQLADHFADPDSFLNNLRGLLDLYTNRTVRPNYMAMRTAIPTYHTPNPVLRQIQKELEPAARENRQNALQLADALWHAGFIESRLIAATLLGSVDPLPDEQILTRLTKWLENTRDEEIRHALLSESLARLRNEAEENFFDLLQSWLKSSNRRVQIWGLQALLPAIRKPGFENLPMIFRLIRPAIKSASPTTQLELQECLVALESISLAETAFFLREVLSLSSKPQTVRIMRRILPSLSEAMQGELRPVLDRPD